jgi:hypothetical protein
LLQAPRNRLAATPAKSQKRLLEMASIGKRGGDMIGAL